MRPISASTRVSRKGARFYLSLKCLCHFFIVLKVERPERKIQRVLRSGQCSRIDKFLKAARQFRHFARNILQLIRRGFHRLAALAVLQ